MRTNYSASNRSIVLWALAITLARPATADSILTFGDQGSASRFPSDLVGVSILALTDSSDQAVTPADTENDLFANIVVELDDKILLDPGAGEVDLLLSIIGINIGAVTPPRVLASGANGKGGFTLEPISLSLFAIGIAAIVAVRRRHDDQRLRAKHGRVRRRTPKIH